MLNYQRIDSLAYDYQNVEYSKFAVEKITPYIVYYNNLARAEQVHK